VVDLREPGRGHAVDELEAAGYPERGPQRGIRKHQLPGARKEVLAVHGAGRGIIYPGYDLNHSYEDCDVFISLAKMKEHSATGVTLSMKNVYGTTPITIYGQDAGVTNRAYAPMAGAAMCFTSRHACHQERAAADRHEYAQDAGFRLPRIVSELNSARPVHLAIIDGIKTATGGETAGGGAKAAVNPGVIIAGTNSVATDAWP